MKSQILYFFLLILKIPFNLGPDAGQKQGRFFKTLSEKGLKLVSSRKNSIVIFDLSFVLLLAKIDPVVEEKSCKKHAFRACSTSCIEMIFTLPTKIIVFHI